MFSAATRHPRVRLTLSVISSSLAREECDGGKKEYLLEEKECLEGSKFEGAGAVEGEVAKCGRDPACEESRYVSKDLGADSKTEAMKGPQNWRSKSSLDQDKNKISSAGNAMPKGERLNLRMIFQDLASSSGGSGTRRQGGMNLHESE